MWVVIFDEACRAFAITPEESVNGLMVIMSWWEYQNGFDASSVIIFGIAKYLNKRHPLAFASALAQTDENKKIEALKRLDLLVKKEATTT